VKITHGAWVGPEEVRIKVFHSQKVGGRTGKNGRKVINEKADRVRRICCGSFANKTAKRDWQKNFAMECCLPAKARKGRPDFLEIPWRGGAREASSKEGLLRKGSIPGLASDALSQRNVQTGRGGVYQVGRDGCERFHESDWVIIDK